MPKTKGTAKKTPKKESKSTIPQAPPGNYFVLKDGRTLRDYKELADLLDGMTDDIYSHHVGKDHNDFATWINDIFKETELAQKLRKSSGKHHSQIIIYRHILKKI